MNSVTTAVEWVGEYRSEGALHFRIGRSGHTLVAEWAGCCTLRSDRAGTESELVADPEADPNLVAKIDHGLAPALLRHLRGKLTLHAAAVSLEGKAVACFGESGAGKSTSIAHLARQLDASLFADDTVAVEFGPDAIHIIPTERVSWLLPEARVALGLSDNDPRKIALAPARAGLGAPPLVALVKLRFDDALPAPSVRRVHGHEALASLVPSLLRFVIDEPDVQLREFEQLSALVRAVPVFELVRPRNLAALSATSDAIAALVRSLGAT